MDELDALQESSYDMKVSVDKVNELQDMFPRCRVVLSCALDSLQKQNYGLVWRLGLCAKNVVDPTQESLLEICSKRLVFFGCRRYIFGGVLLTKILLFTGESLDMIKC